MKRIERYFSLLVVNVLLSGCFGNPQLDRNSAEQLIEKSDFFTQDHHEVRMHEKGRDFGISFGFWDKSNKLAPEMKSIISKVDFTNLTTVNPFRLKLEVTGIVDVPLGEGRVKKIEYQWSYAGLNNIVAFFSVNGGTGASVAQLYDDGWRLVENPSEFKYSKQIIDKGAETQLAIEKKHSEILERTQRVAKAQAVERERLAKEQAARNKRIENARSAALRTSKFPYSVGDILISDTAMSCGGKKEICWIGDIERVQYWGDRQIEIDIRKEVVAKSFRNHRVWWQFKSQEETNRAMKNIESVFSSWKSKYSDDLQRYPRFN